MSFRHPNLLSDGGDITDDYAHNAWNLRRLAKIVSGTVALILLASTAQCRKKSAEGIFVPAPSLSTESVLGDNHVQ